MRAAAAKPEAPATAASPPDISFRRDSLLPMRLSAFHGVTRDHCTHANFEARKANHRDMHEKKQNERNRRKEMNGASGLLAAKGVHNCGEDRRKCRRHGKPC